MAVAELHLRTTKQATFDNTRLDAVCKKDVGYRNQREGVQEIILVRAIAIKSTAWSGYSPLISGVYRMQGLARKRHPKILNRTREIVQSV